MSQNTTKESLSPKAKKTIKQSTLLENSLGMAAEPRNDAYLSTDVQAVGTQRASTSIEYFGDADGPDLGGYDVTEVDAKKTKKQDVSDYTGNAGNDGRKIADRRFRDQIQAHQEVHSQIG